MTGNDGGAGSQRAAEQRRAKTLAAGELARAAAAVHVGQLPEQGQAERRVEVERKGAAAVMAAANVRRRCVATVTQRCTRTVAVLAAVAVLAVVTDRGARSAREQC